MSGMGIDGDKAECAACCNIAVTRMGALLVCVEHILWAAEKLRPTIALVEPLTDIGLPVVDRIRPPGVS